jgi:uncharacterized protein HemX
MTDIISAIPGSGIAHTVESVVETAAAGPLAVVKGFIGGYKAKIILVLIALAIGAGGFMVLQNRWLINKNVATQVANHDQNATIQTLTTKSKVDDASAKIDEQFAQKHEKTEKEYIYVRQQIQSAPADARNAPAPAIIVDTLNGLERLHDDAASGVPDAHVPAK